MQEICTVLTQNQTDIFQISTKNMEEFTPVYRGRIILLWQIGIYVHCWQNKEDEVSSLIKPSCEAGSRVTPQKLQKVYVTLKIPFTSQFQIVSRY